MKRQRILEEWNKFAEQVLPKVCSQNQREDMKHAFYAGAFIVLMVTTRDSSTGDAITESDLELVGDLDEEVRGYFLKLSKEHGKYKN